MSKGTIVLISLYSYQSIGVRSLYFELLKKGFDVRLIYFLKSKGINTKYPSEEDYKLLINLLKEINPPLVGISVLTLAFEIAVAITKKIRENMDSLIIWGGVHALIKPEECIKFADVVCEWEGEESIPELCNRFFEGEGYEGIPNLWIRKENKLIKNPIKIIEDLDKLALPDFSLDNFYYIEGGKMTKGKYQLSYDDSYYIITGRGCPNRCTYCINNTLAKKVRGGYIRRRSVKNVIKELKIVKENYNNLKKIKFLDDIFALDLSWMKEFAEIYRNEIGIPFWCNLHVTTTNDEIIALLKYAGCVDSNIGVESGSQRFREEVYHKYISNEKIYNAIKIIKKYNLTCGINIILNNPLESDEDLREGVKFLLSLRPVSLALCSLTNYPSTELTERLLNEGLIKREDILLRDSIGFRVCKKQLFRNNRDEYWFYIFNFISKQYIPKFLILFLTKDIFVKNHRLLIGIFKVGLKLYQLKEKLGNEPSSKTVEIMDDDT